MELFEIILFCLLILGSLYGLIFIRKSPSLQLSTKITLKKLSEYEDSIFGLKEVIIVANKVEEPTGDLLKAVISNLKNGVIYTFLISKSNYDENDKYYKIFEAISKSVSDVNENVRIYSLKFDWKGKPNVFYKFKESSENPSVKIFGYEGNQLLTGISEEYTLINDDTAYNTLALALNNANIEERLEEIEFMNVFPRVIQINQRR